MGLHLTVEDGRFKFSIVKLDNPETKRVVLATIASLYDPLRFATPKTLVFKALLQRLWQSKMDWDEQLPPNELQKWKELKEGLPSIAKFNPFIGENGLVRVGSRLEYAAISFDVKFAAILPKHYVIVEVLAKHTVYTAATLISAKNKPSVDSVKSFGFAKLVRSYVESSTNVLRAEKPIHNFNNKWHRCHLVE